MGTTIYRSYPYPDGSHAVAPTEYVKALADAIDADVHGKASVGHTHDDRYFTEAETSAAIAASRWERGAAGVDANAVTQSGAYTTGASTANTPRPEGGHLTHLVLAGGVYTQGWVSQIYPHVHRYVRRRAGGVWSAWTQLPQKGDKGDRGLAGATGPTGPALSLSVGDVVTGAPGTAASATVRNVAGGQALDLTIPTGPAGSGTVDGDAAVRTYAETPGLSTHDYLHAEFAPLDRTQRLALADRITAWMATELENDRGDWNMQALLRRLRLRKTSATAKTMFAVDAADEQPQSTGAGISLQFLAEFAKAFPERAETLKPLATRVAETLIAMQCQNPNKPFYGGIMAAPGQVLYNALGAGQAVKGLVSAYEVWGVGQWLEAAKRAGTFLLTLIDPNPTYQRLYGHDVTALPAGAATICTRIGSSGQINVTSMAWDLVGIHALYRLSDVTGDETYRAAALPVRDFMATTLTGYYDYYAGKATATALADGTATEQFPLESTAPQGTNAFQRRGDAINVGTIESDSMEYALTALWHTGYDLTAIKTAYEHLTSLVQWGTAGTAEFRAEYDATGRMTCWPGYFRINYQGGDWAFGGYYDSQGAGELLAFKKAHYPDHYRLSFDIIRAIIEPDRGALLTTGYQTMWSDNGDGTVYAVQGVIPIAVAGLGLIETTDPTPMEVTA